MGVTCYQKDEEKIENEKNEKTSGKKRNSKKGGKKNMKIENDESENTNNNQFKNDEDSISAKDEVKNVFINVNYPPSHQEEKNPNTKIINQKMEINNPKTEENNQKTEVKYPNFEELYQEEKVDNPIPIKPPKPPKSTKPTYYDAVFRCESCKELFKKGWNFFINDKFIQRMTDENEICPMCVLGETNKGKTFLVNILTGKNLKAGIEHKTEGMSCKFSDFKYSYDEVGKYDEINEQEKSEINKFLIFDTAGRSEPLLRDKTNEEKGRDLKKIVDENYRDLKISEDFLKNLLINNSQIILIVVNQLSLSEQIFLYQLKNQRNFDQLFVIHNLFNFQSKKDLENYIDNTIVRSIYFDMSKNYYPSKNGNQNSIDRPYYFVENQNNNGSESLIAHFILGNMETKDPWIKDFNDQTLTIIKEIMQTCAANRLFTIKEILEKELIDENKIDKQIMLKEDDKCEISEEDKPKNCPPNYYKKIGTLKLNKEDSDLSKTNNNFIKGTGFTDFTGYNPDYVFYKNNNDTEFVIEVECAGEEDKDISITAKESKGKVYFNITGKKIYPKEFNLKDKPFSIEFFVNIEKECITIVTGKDVDQKKPIYENGIYKKIFTMSKYTSKTK